ncbi:Z-DNA-binding protein 1 isoform X1 [Neophocaena asiaeorientalis asiaeorientalis]|uniref:Z-DNA-binding protein 1 isoform X1 n=1 Tax=Neophocaena asiaeorientalis asiaeorientalis TaxID=1706337 RepID=A0A341BWT8_NEOAA|nr:Z-DNA-binding protein 1 isoform X1 [Neophocaena asiaeorientalis asiaeorientalis]
MAEAPASPGDADLEQRILEVLRDSGSPVKTAQLVMKCQVPRKKLNQVLYKMQKESKAVLLVGPATWCLTNGGTKEVVPAELAERPQKDAVAIPRKPGSELSQRQEEIFRFLEAHGPHRALIIAQALGMKTAKEVNPDLYAMRNKHLLDLDQKSNTWAIYRPEGSTNQSTPVIYQQNPINMISQNGLNSHISIENSEAIQIGHRNVMVRKMASGENGSSAPLYLPPLAPTDPSTQGPLAGSWGPQDIRVEKSVLRHVQMGHGNEMSLHGNPAKGPAHSACGSPPGLAASIKIQIPEPGPHSEGGVAQRVHIRSCFLEDTTIGNNNKMIVRLGAADPRGVARAGEPGGSTDPPSGAARFRSEVPPGSSQAAPVNAETLISEELATMTLKTQGSQKCGRHLLSDRISEPVSLEGGTQSKKPVGGLPQEGPGSQ